MSFRLNLAVLSEQKQHCRFGLTLHNLSDFDLVDWTLNFTLDRFIEADSITQGELKQVGSFCTFLPKSKTIKANNYFYTEFIIKTAPFRFHSDGIDDAFIQTQDSTGPRKIAVELPPLALASPHKERTQVPNVTPASMSLIPKPNQIELLSEPDIHCAALILNSDNDTAKQAMMWFKEELSRLYPSASCLITSDHRKNHQGTLPVTFIERRKHISDTEHPIAGHYKLRVNQQSIEIHASDQAGFVHACATLLQLVNVTQSQIIIPSVEIKDSPRYQYRGMMLDCSRHFHPIERVKRVINQLAHYKFNTFHWHLTDDEGWRIEIKSLPELTTIGAWRGVDHTIEPQYTNIAEHYGGFYTQKEIREVIEFADKRGITIIPEIDIPGHCRAAIKALPELLQDPEDNSRYRSIQHYSDNVLSPGIEGTYQFIDKVLEEVAALFPAPYVHIGADEVPEGVWVDSPSCQALMRSHDYQDPKELQGHLLQYAERKLKSLGKRMLGWEEAQHGNKVSRDTVIYSWISEDAALQCAKQGFDVVLQPAQFTYLDMTQDFSPDEPGVDWANVIPLEHAYSYEPLADIKDSDPIRKRILGVQCALWCEIINNQSTMDYMMFPRITALAEACWTEKKQRSYFDYLSRLSGHLPMLQCQDIQYRDPWKPMQPKSS